MAEDGNPRDMAFQIVGIGASAGGLNSLQCFIAALPEEFGFSVVFLQHLSPKHKSLLPELLLAKRADLRIEEITDGLEVLPGKIYLCPAGGEVRLRKGMFHLLPPSRDHIHYAIDEFFASLAEEAGGRAIAVIFSGAGTDGARGIQAVRTAGGMVFVQDPATAEFPSMPQAAINTLQVDGVFAPEEIAREILGLQAPIEAASKPDSEIMPADFEAFSRLIYDRTGHRFDHYKKSVVGRRISRRMYLRGFSSARDYMDMIAKDDHEASLLSADLMIGVTSFFRDRLAWKALRTGVIRKLTAENDATPIRVWTPACATGEEAYSIAMLLHDELGLTASRREIQIFATDVSESSLERAREGKYPGSIAADLPPDYMRKYFTSQEDGLSVVVNKEIRESVVFARQDILTDPPFSRLDLIICRNLLIYLGPEAQEKCISIFHYSLKEGGHLFLGNAESVGRKNMLFKSLPHKKCRIFIKTETKSSSRLPLAVPFATERAAFRPPKPASDTERREAITGVVQEALLEEYAPAAVAINQNFEILYHNGPTNNYLRQPRGTPTQDLLELLPEKLHGRVKARIRGGLYRAMHEERPVSIRASIAVEEGRKRSVTIRMSKLNEDLILVVFRPSASEKTGHVANASDLSSEAAEFDNNVMLQLESELSATREELQSHIEQLKSLNEELQSSNEELQAANEELETSREELQSLNEELITVNAQLQSKVEEQEETNNDLNNFIASTNVPTVFLDQRFRVKLFSPAMSKLVQLIPSDIGRPIIDLSQERLGPGLITDAKSVLDNLVPVKKEIAINGNWYIRSAQPYRTSDNRIEGVVVTYNDITDLKRAEEQTIHLASFPQMNPTPVLEVDSSGSLTFVNPATIKNLEGLGMTREDINVFLPSDLDRILRDWDRKTEASLYREQIINDRVFGENIYLVPQFNVARIYAQDITERKRAEEMKGHLAAIVENAEDAIISKDLTGVIQTWNAGAENIFGYTAKEVLGKNISFMVPPGHDNEMPDIISRIKQGEHVARYETVRMRKTGEIIPVSLTFSPIKDSNGKVVGVSKTAHDITGRKLAEKAMLESEGRLRLFIEHAPAALAMFDNDMRYLAVSRRWLVDYGLADLDVIGKSHYEIFPEIPEHWKEAHRRGLAGEVLHADADFFQRTDGSIQWVKWEVRPLFNVEGRVSGIVIFTEDITERKRAEEAVLRAKEEWERTFNSVPDMIAIIDNEHRIVRMNNAMAQRLRVKAEECIGHHCYEHVHGLQCPPEFCPHVRSIKDGGQHLQEVHESLLGADFLVSTTPLFDDKGNMTSSVHVAHDITELKRAEETLRRLNEDLERQVTERTRFYSILAKINETLVRVREQQTLFDEVCRIIVEEGSFRLAWIGIKDQKSLEVRPVSSYGETAYLKGVRIIADDVPEGKGPTGRAVYEDRYVINSDFEGNPDLLPWREKARAHGLRSSSSFPLHAGGRVVGALTLYADRPDFFSEEEVALVLALSEDISFALESMDNEKRRSMAETELRRLNEELELRVKKRTEELERLNSELEAFIYSVSHDLRAPLRTVSGFARFIEEDYAAGIDKQGKEYLAHVIPYQAYISHPKDRRLRVGVNGYDLFRSLHAHEMLDRSRNADPDIKLWRYRLSGLTDLALVGHQAGFHHRPGTGHRSSDQVSQFLEEGHGSRITGALSRNDQS